MVSVLVTGGAGFIGSKVVEKLSTKHDVIVLDITTPREAPESVLYVTGDALDLNLVKKIIVDYSIECIIHLVGLPVIPLCRRNPMLSYKLNAESVQIIAEAARINNVRRIIFASSACVYGMPKKNPVTEDTPPNPTNVYGHHKLIGEQILKAYSQEFGLDAVALRLFNVFGANPTYGKDVISIFIRKVKAGEKLRIIDPDKFRDFIHVDYVAEAFMRALEAEIEGFEIINIGSGHPTTIRELVEIIEEASEKSVDKEIVITNENGTGYFADTSKMMELLGLTVSNPKQELKKFVANWIGG